MAFTHPCVLCSGLLVIAASSQHTCFVVVVVVWCVMYDWCKMKTMFGVRDSTRPYQEKMFGFSCFLNLAPNYLEKPSIPPFCLSIA